MGLAFEALLCSWARGGVRWQDHDRHRAVEPRVARAIHLAHAAGADLRGDFVDAEAGAGGEEEVEVRDEGAIAEAPRLAPHIAAMRARLAQALGVGVDLVSVGDSVCRTPVTSCVCSGEMHGWSHSCVRPAPSRRRFIRIDVPSPWISRA